MVIKNVKRTIEVSKIPATNQIPKAISNAKLNKKNEHDNILSMKRHSLCKLKKPKPNETPSKNDQEHFFDAHILSDCIMKPAPPPGIVRRMASSINRHNRFISSFCKEPKLNSAAESVKSSTHNDLLTNSVALDDKHNKLIGADEMNFHLMETQNGIQIQITQPHLISVLLVHKNDNNDNEYEASNSKTKIKIYPLKAGRTTIGSSLSNDIVLNGSGIELEHCFIECVQSTQNDLHIANKISVGLNCKETKAFSAPISNLFARSHDNKPSVISDQTLFNFVTLFPLAKLCSVDGVLIDQPYELNSGNVICFGESESFRYHNNNNNQIKNKSAKTSKPNENEQNLNPFIEKKQEIESEITKMIESRDKIKDQSKNFKRPTNSSQNTNSHNNQRNSNVQTDLKDKQGIIKFDLKPSANFLSTNQTSNKSNKVQIEQDSQNHTTNSIQNSKKRSELFNVLKESSEKNEKTLPKEEVKSQVYLPNKGEFTLRRKVSQKFLSKLTKFELLARGLKLNEFKSISPSSTSSSDSSIGLTDEQQIAQTEAENITKLEEEHEEYSGNEMKTLKKLREFRSKSFGCEKELQKQILNGESSRNQSKPNTATNKIKEKKISNKKSEMPIETKKEVELKTKEKENEDLNESKKKINEKNSSGKMFKLVDVDKLHFIDDEVESSLTLEMKKPQLDEDYDEDDYDENGDSLTMRRASRLGNNKNNFERILNGDDFDLLLSDNTINIISDEQGHDEDETDFDEDQSMSEEFSKCQSAPILTQSKPGTFHSPSDSNAKKNSFVYDINLYDDKQNFVLTNQDEMNRLIIEQQKRKYVAIGENDLSESSCASYITFNSSKPNSLEPLLVNESYTKTTTTPNTVNTTLESLHIKTQVQLETSRSDVNKEIGVFKSGSLSSSSTVILTSNDNQQAEKELLITERSQIDLASLSNSSTSSASVSDSCAANSLHTTVTTTTNNSISEHQMPEYVLDVLGTFGKEEDRELSQSAFLPNNQCKASKHDSSQQDETNSLFEDVSQISDTLKHNYVQAKRERELEQEVAQLEKLRLQEIIDICMEFERQEKLKVIFTSNSSSSTSSTSPLLSFSTKKTTHNDHPTPSTCSVIQSSSAIETRTNAKTTASLESSLSALIPSNKKKNVPTSDHNKQNSPTSTSSSSSSASSSSASVNEQRQMNLKELKTLPTLNHIIHANKHVSFQIGPTHLEIQQEAEKCKFNQVQINKLQRDKNDLMSNLSYLKQRIQEVEMRQNAAIRELEMERALLDVEHQNELKNIQNDEVKLRKLQEEHQMRLETFTLHTSQIRNDIEMLQMTIRGIENEIIILDNTLDTNLLGDSKALNSPCLTATTQHLEQIKMQKECALDEAKRAHEDLEFQLMELEAKYESELEDIQTRLIKEQDSLLDVFKQRRVNINDYDQQQAQMIFKVKEETENLESERQSLIEKFRKQREHLELIEKKLVKLQEENASNNTPSFDSCGQEKENLEKEDRQRCDIIQQSPSPTSSSVSLTSSANTSSDNPLGNGFRTAQLINEYSKEVFKLSPVHNSNGKTKPLQAHQSALSPKQNTDGKIFTNNTPQPHQQIKPMTKKQMSQSFKDIIENTLLINGLNVNDIQSASVKSSKAHPQTHPQQQYFKLNHCHTFKQPHLIKSTGSLNTNETQQIFLVKENPMLEKELSKLSSTSILTDSVNTLVSVPLHMQQQHKEGPKSPTNQKMSSQMAITKSPPLLNTQLAVKFAELERTLACTKAENNNLLEQQLQARERELNLLKEEKRKREELERQLNEEIYLREKIIEENIKLRDKKPASQARPLTRYLPIRDNNFDLRQHIENSGHQLLNQIDAHTKLPLVYISSNICRGYLLKMGQKFKTWNKRWFVFDRLKRTFSYYSDKHEQKLRGCIYFQSINEVYVDHMKTIKSPDSKSTFVMKTNNRNFYFVAPTSELMRIWVDVIITGAEGYMEFND